jgi:glyoxylate/hydroxypyruvate reductase A
MPVLLFISQIEAAKPWKRALERALPGIEVRIWPEAGARACVDYVLCWNPPAGVFRGMDNLKAVFSLGAGVDHLSDRRALPDDVPVVRMVEPALTEGMSEYVIYQVLRFHRRMADYDAQQSRKEWRGRSQVRPRERRIGIMGLGVLGQDAAAKLRVLDFDVAGWSKSEKKISGVHSFAGTGGLEAFLERTDILVCMLPLTQETRGILSRRHLDRLPKGACVINAARGPHLVEADLLAALDCGHIAGAALDVFHQEPLPADHPFWTHPKVTLTPHIASLTNPETGARAIADQIARCESGRLPRNMVDFSRGY